MWPSSLIQTEQKHLKKFPPKSDIYCKKKIQKLLKMMILNSLAFWTSSDSPQIELDWAAGFTVYNRRSFILYDYIPSSPPV